MNATARKARKEANRQPQPGRDADVFWLVPDWLAKLLTAKRFDEALTLATREIERQPEFGLAYAARAGVVMEMVANTSPEDTAKLFNDALADCNRAIELAPDHGGGFGMRGLALRGLGRRDEARADFDRAAALAPEIELLQRYRQQYGPPVIPIVESKARPYTGNTPSPEAAVTPPLRMGDDLNIQVKQAQAEALAPMAAALALARYEVLARHVDLLNPRLTEDERLRRAERLVKAYERARKANPDFRDTGEELRAARRIRMADFRQRKRAKLHAHEAA
jgi:tetratricopeptide (TPR) repeat protein